MEFKVSDENKNKIKLFLIPIGVILLFYLFFKYIFPLIWPLAVSAGLALLLYPLIRFLHQRLKINKMISTILILVLLTFILGLLTALVVEKLVLQIQLFADHFDYYEQCFNAAVCAVCCRVEQAFGMEDGSILTVINDGIGDFFQKINHKIMQFLIGISIPAVRSIIDVIVAAAIIIVAFFLMIKDMEKIKEGVRKSAFAKECSFFYQRCAVAFKAYIRTQLILMAIVAAVSVLGLTCAGSRYAWLIGISVGVLDALPLFGAGIILIPMTIAAVIQAKLVKAAILFTTFIACYFIREFLEPKLMGDKIGIGPLTTMAGIYVGYRLFGFPGMFAGIFTVIVLSDVLKLLKEKSVL